MFFFFVYHIWGKQGRPYVGAMRVAHVGAVHCIGHENVDQTIIQRATVLEDLQVGEYGLKVASNCGEPGRFLEALIRTSLCDTRLHFLGSLQCLVVSNLGQY